MAVATFITIGSTGEEVRRLQASLQAQGFDPGRADGHFGALTDDAVRRLQQVKGLLVDGIVGPETLIALEGTVAAITVQGTLVDLGLVAERDFGLTIGECSAPGAPARWGPVHSGHSANSFHFKGRAFDAGGSAEDLRRFSAFVTERFSGNVAELIHNPNGSIKDGVRVDPGFWGDDTFAAHAGHVHLAI